MHTNVRRIREARVTYDLLLPGKDEEEGDDEKQLRCIHRVFIRVFDISRNELSLLFLFFQQIVLNRTFLQFFSNNFIYIFLLQVSQQL